LECALEAKADLIITADKDLLVLKEFNGIKIIHTSSLKYIFPQLKKPKD
jgi:predicted nucleic acid-binding protein